MDDISIDQNKLPGVKEVCRDFAVLEDHCLAHNLQEQEIENHLASNIHKNRLVQQDLRVAKRLQEEEDQRAKVKNQKQQKDIERIDNEMAQEIQEQLVWQAEQQRQQEEKDEAIARKLQEREMKEERRRQKQMEAKLEEQYYEDRGRNIQGQYGVRDAVQGLAQMDLRAQEMRDIEVARRLQEEEVKASRIDKRAAQVAQDEEIARRIMEDDEREYRRSREKDKHAMERQQRRADGDFKPVKEDGIRPRTREEYDYQRVRNPKPTRPPTRTRDYENVDSSYGHSDIYSHGPLSRPETAYKGAYYRQ